MWLGLLPMRTAKPSAASSLSVGGACAQPHASAALPRQPRTTSALLRRRRRRSGFAGSGLGPRMPRSSRRGAVRWSCGARPGRRRERRRKRHRSICCARPKSAKPRPGTCSRKRSGRLWKHSASSAWPRRRRPRRPTVVAPASSPWRSGSALRSGTRSCCRSRRSDCRRDGPDWRQRSKASSRQPDCREPPTGTMWRADFRATRRPTSSVHEIPKRMPKAVVQHPNTGSCLGTSRTRGWCDGFAARLLGGRRHDIGPRNSALYIALG
mmetsp:Transcript_129615/g.276439  ORF Transcript_129615/g.276439 Transcript_129615/m.276439 type:complete len:267 (-) Transcript_129615:28-828(-)